MTSVPGAVKEMKQPLIDLRGQYQTLKTEIDEALGAVLKRGDFILGLEVRELEKEIAKYLGVQYAIGVASGTDALTIALRSCGIGPGHEVITTPFTFIATAESIHQVGARPVFADIDPETLNIDPKEIEKKITKKTRAIIPVHLYGEPADMDGIQAVIRNKGIALIEDCAQAMGASYKRKKVGTFGRAGCFSFFPGKNLGCYGDGGLVVTDNEDIARTARVVRAHGSVSKYEHSTAGYNSRLDTIQAAVLLVKLKHLDQWNEKRREHARAYREGLAPRGCSFPALNENALSAMNYFTFLVHNGRDEMREYLSGQGIATGIYYPISLHLQKVFDFLGYKKGDFPVAEEKQEKILSLPMYPELTDEQIKNIINIITHYKNKENQ